MNFDRVLSSTLQWEEVVQREPDDGASGSNRAGPVPLVRWPRGTQLMCGVGRSGLLLLGGPCERRLSVSQMMRWRVVEAQETTTSSIRVPGHFRGDNHIPRSCCGLPILMYSTLLRTGVGISEDSHRIACFECKCHCATPHVITPSILRPSPQSTPRLGSTYVCHYTVASPHARQ